MYIMPKITTKDIKTIVSQKGFKLMSILSELKGITTEIEWMCKCGELNITQLRAVKYRKTKTCRYCHSSIIIANNNITRHVPKNKRKKMSIEWNDIHDFFKSMNCLLLTTGYVDDDTMMHYICSCGNEAHTSWANFKSGYRCSTHFSSYLYNRVDEYVDNYINNVFKIVYN